jgi:hypothetical protein
MNRMTSGHFRFRFLYLAIPDVDAPQYPRLYHRIIREHHRGLQPSVVVLVDFFPPILTSRILDFFFIVKTESSWRGEVYMQK